jgi:hypothetical protein
MVTPKTKTPRGKKKKKKPQSKSFMTLDLAIISWMEQQITNWSS